MIILKVSVKLVRKNSTGVEWIKYLTLNTCYLNNFYCPTERFVILIVYLKFFNKSLKLKVLSRSGSKIYLLGSQGFRVSWLGHGFHI